MSNSSGISNVPKLEADISELIAALKKLQTDIEEASSILKTMMKGDDEGPYWNGNTALRFYNKAKTNLENNAADYNKAYGSINAIAVQLEDLKIADRK